MTDSVKEEGDKLEIAENRIEICRQETKDSLYLSDLGLTELPEGIRGLTDLKVLVLRENRITTLPGWIGSLTSLVKLDIGANDITELPAELLELKGLKHLELENNPLPGLSKELLATADAQRILSVYFRARDASTARTLREVKVHVVGQSEVGKTSLIKQLSGDAHNRAEKKTEGTAKRPLQMRCGSKGSVKLSLWDFGGQEIMHSTHQFFLTARSVYVLVLDSRQDERASRVEYWLRLIQTYGGDSPVIVVCNKFDEQPMKLAWDTLREKYPQIKYYVREVSCQGSERKGIAPGHGIDAVRTALAEVVEKYVDHIDRPFRKEWFALKEALEDKNESYLTFDQYDSVCAEHKVEVQDREPLLGTLNDLGIMLHFGDHPVMRDRHVLQPDWVTAAIYRALNDYELNRNHGLLSRAELRRILSDVPHHEYLPKHEEFILEMMRKFELCFPFDAGDSVLIPDLLQKEPPVLDSPPEALTFRYRYSVLPGSVISRFIVKMHTHIVPNAYWLTGVMLKRGRNRAKVVADLEDAFIDIRVDGPRADRRALLEMIRGAFESIHATFSNRLDVREFVPVPGHEEELLAYDTLLKAKAEGETSYYTKSSGRVPLVVLLQGMAGVEEFSEEPRRFGERNPIGTETMVSKGIAFPATPKPKPRQETEQEAKADGWWKAALGACIAVGALAVAIVFLPWLWARILLGTAAFVTAVMFARNPAFFHRLMMGVVFAAMLIFNAIGFTVQASLKGAAGEASFQWDKTTSIPFTIICGVILVTLLMLDPHGGNRDRDRK